MLTTFTSGVIQVPGFTPGFTQDELEATYTRQEVKNPFADKHIKRHDHLPRQGAATMSVPHVLYATRVAPNAYFAMQLAGRERDYGIGKKGPYDELFEPVKFIFGRDIKSERLSKDEGGRLVSEAFKLLELQYDLRADGRSYKSVMGSFHMRRAMEGGDRNAMNKILLAWLANHETRYGGRRLVIVNYSTMRTTRPDLLAESAMKFLRDD